MPFRSHPAFKEPAPDTKLWRYMDVLKLLSMVQSGRLFFVRVDKLNDPYEAVIPPINLAKLEEEIRANVPQHVADHAWAGVQRIKSDERRFVKRDLSRFTVVSCWHAANDESDAMWKIYSGTSAVAVQTTFGRLTSALAHADQVIYAGLVNYIDPSCTPIPKDNLFHAFMHKRHSFKHEQEVRVIHGTWPTDDELQNGGLGDSGIYIKVHLEQLLERIYISPFAEPWHRGVIDTFVRAAGLQVPVIDSPLYQPPFLD